MHHGRKYGILALVMMMMTKMLLMVILMLMMMKKVAACPRSPDLYGSLRPPGLLYKAKAKADLYDKCPN